MRSDLLNELKKECHKLSTKMDVYHLAYIMDVQLVRKVQKSICSEILRIISVFCGLVNFIYFLIYMHYAITSNQANSM